ncbi:MAG TPA: amino acid permease [Puia sp.]|jgi:APA family basic amino acid/polyamine antiporter
MLARAISTLDHILKGRLTINIINSDLPGLREYPKMRYQRCAETIEILNARDVCARYCDMFLMWPETEESMYETMKDLSARAARYDRTLDFGLRIHVVPFVAGEIKNPKRNIGLSLLLGTLIVTFLYVLLNLMFTGGTAVIAVMIMIATFGCNNGLILAGARVYYSMAKDGLFFRRTGELNKEAVPAFGLWIQAGMASILCLSGKYEDLLDMISFVVVIYYILTIFGIYILRVKKPEHERPYKAIGYPVLPAIYILMGLFFCGLLIVYKPGFTWPGLIIALLGIPVYYLRRKNDRHAAGAEG